MKYRTRIYYTAERKAEMWDRWQRGESINSSRTQNGLTPPLSVQMLSEIIRVFHIVVHDEVLAV
jgi:hypothetical protein